MYPEDEYVEEINEQVVRSHYEGGVDLRNRDFLNLMVAIEAENRSLSED